MAVAIAATTQGARDVRPILLCAALSVSVHAAVLAYHAAPSLQPSSKPTGQRSGSTASGTTRVRVIPQRPVTVSGKAEIVKKRQREPSDIGGFAAPSHSPVESIVASAPVHENTSNLGGTPHPFIERVAEAPEPTSDERSHFNEGIDMPSGDFDGSSYIPRSLLTIAPSPLTTIVLDVPEGNFTAVRYVGVLSLFIDEEGRVKHVAAEEATLPPAFEQVAREAFMAASFTPGQLEGRMVKSRQRVEVVFDSGLK